MDDVEKGLRKHFKETRGTIDNDKSIEIPIYYILGFETLTKSVRRMLLDAEIKGIKSVPTGLFDSGPYVQPLITALESERKGLE